MKRRFGPALAALTALWLTTTSAAPQKAPPVPAPPGATPAAQPSGQRFRSGIDLVTLDVSVLDRDRRPVRGLTAADFAVLDEGQPQPIETFSAIDIPEPDPAAAAWVRNVQPDVERNDRLSEGRTILIVMDDATPTMAEDVLRTRKLGEQVIDGLGPDDLAAVIYTLSRNAGQDFTRDHQKLRAAVRRFNATVPLGSALSADGGTPPPAGNFAAFDHSASTLYLSTISTLRMLAEGMAALPQRRKALIFLSVGLPLDFTLGGPADVSIAGTAGQQGSAQKLIDELGLSLRAAQRSNVSIYSMDPGGLRVTASTLNVDFLKTLSENTGGFSITETNDATGGIAQVYRENGTYYVLGYRRPETGPKGRYRRVAVRVTRPDVIVRARSGYFEARPTEVKAQSASAASMERAISELVPVPDVALRVSAMAFARPGGLEGVVAVVVNVREPAPVTTARETEEISALVQAYDSGGKLRGSTVMKGAIVLRSGASPEAVYELLGRLDLKPGRYQLRTAVSSSRLQKTGSVYTEVDVPAFAKDALSMSGVAIAVSPAWHAGPAGALSDLVPIVPTTAREFAHDADVTAFARIYQGASATIEPVSVDVTIQNASGKTEVHATEKIPAVTFTKGRTADFSYNVPVGTLPRGAYLLSIGVWSASVGRRTGEMPIRRDVRFVVQ